ncbi:MAG: hypothetical protein JSW08_03400 [archaeon]|nr:MAG: hypothetical protein JSW08_03400 [archaeon]
MDLDEVTERATIKFGKPISWTEAERMLGYVAQRTGLEMGYTVEQRKRIKPDKTDPDSIPEPQYDFVIVEAGAMHNEELACVGTFFLTIPPEERGDGTIADRLVFPTLPGMPLKAHGEKAIKLWDDVRTAVAEYFQQPQESPESQ